jgi:predicted nuclease of restriction endonuclease-like RecB superfamily
VKRLKTMLPNELLAVWKRKGLIWPRYANLSDDNLEVASSLIEAYKNHVGEKKSAVKEFVDVAEEKGYDYRFVRGLSFLLDRRSRFRCNEKINAVNLRREIYDVTGKFGLPTTPEQRTRIVKAVASELKVTAEAVEEFLYADLETELLLEKFEPLSPVELLQDYNLSLTQTLLFDSTEARFTSSGNWQKIFHSIKRLGLIYEAYHDGGFWVKVDGPASLFKLTRRYGTAMAKLLPFIVSVPDWTVEAKILWKYTNEICNFKLESWKHLALLRKAKTSVLSFDSMVEEDFAARFQALATGWLLRREPEPVLAGKQVIIPDFSLEKEGIRIYVEIVGFWTVEYLLNKVEKLKKVEVDMLVLVNDNLACEKLAKLEEHAKLSIVYYRDKISLAPIIHHLEQAFQEVKARQIGFVKDLPVVFTEPVVNYEEFAARIGVSAEAVKAAFADEAPQGYTVMPNEVVRKDVLKQIQRRIEEQMSQEGQLCLSEAVTSIEAEGVGDATSALEALGYKVVWHGINSEKAEVVKA